MNFLYAFILLLGFVGELYSADAQRHRALVGLAKIVHDATPLPTDLREMVENYVGAHHLWEAAVPTAGRCFVRKLSNQEFAVVEQNGRINVLDAQTGEPKRSVLSRSQLDVLAAEALSPQHVVLALKRGMLRVVDLGKKGGSSSFDIPGVPDVPEYMCRFKGLALVKEGMMPELVVGDNQGWRSSIHAFKIDLQKRKHVRASYGVNGFPECITALPDGRVRYTQCQDGVLRNSICTRDLTTGNEEWMETPHYDDLSNPEDWWVPERITGKNLFVWKFAPETHLRYMRNGKDLGIMPSGQHEHLVADIPGGFVTGFGNQLLARDEDGNIIQELLQGGEIREVRYHGGLLTAVSSGAHGEKLSAWRIGASQDELKNNDE